MCVSYIVHQSVRSMVQLVVWGSNIAGNLSPDPNEEIYIQTPTIVKRKTGEEVERIIWASWTCTIPKSEPYLSNSSRKRELKLVRCTWET